MIRFIYGTSGTGKTTTAQNILVALRKQGKTKLMMLVPDQSSFATETSFLDLLGPKMSRDVLIFGFSRLCNYVFTSTGNLRDNVIDDGVRSILMSKALDELQDQITIFNGKNKRKSVINLMLQSLKECKEDKISPEMLEEVSDLIGDRTLKNKLKETALVLSTYESLIANTYIDPLDNLTRLASILCDHQIFKDYTIIVDSFSGFSSQQLDIIRILMTQCKNIYITFEIDEKYKDLDFYKTSSQTISNIKRIAKDNDIEIGEKIVLTDFCRSEKTDLKFLQKNIFGIENNTFTDKAENIESFIANDVYEESSYVANRIKRLVAECDYRYKDIAIITRSNAKYNGVLGVILEKNNIPYFMDIPQNIYASPAIRFICNGIDSVLKGFDKEFVLSMLKTGLTQVSEEMISDFENYLFVWQIDRKNLKKEFTDNPSGFESVKDSDIEKLNEIENTRKSVIEPLIKFQERTKNTTGIEISRSIYELMEDFEISKSIRTLSKKLEKQGFISEANQLVRVYNLIMEALDKLVAVVGDKEISLAKYKEYLDFQIENMEISDIPQYQDQVVVATADRVRLSPVKAVFVVGAIESEFPLVPIRKGIFSENERRLLIENKLPLTDSLEELSCYEKYLVYCALTSASEKLYISCHTSDFAGSTFSPSIIFEEIDRLFTDYNKLKSADINDFNELWSQQQAFECLAKNYTQNTPEVSALKSYFSQIDGYDKLMESIELFLENKPFKIQDKKIAEKLFKKNMFISASQIEKYSLCAFQYFCNYGLRAKERKVASIDAMQFGNIVHYFLEKFLEKNNKEVLNQISDDELHKSIDDILEEYANETFGGLQDKSNSFINLYNRLKKNIFTLIKAIIRQLEYSDFVPTDFELKIGDEKNIPYYKVDIDEEHSISVNGFIDRVDTMAKSDDELYVRIVDYKTGNKTFTLSEIMYGVNLQMLIYLRAITKNGENYYGKKLIPTGILYMPSFTNEISADKSITQDDIRKELDKNFKMNGLLLNDAEVLNHMDRNGKFIKLGRKSKTAIYNDNLATSEQFEDIFRHIDDTVKNMGTELLSGNVPAKPVKGEINGCKYCSFDSVCCHKSTDKYKFTQKLTADCVYEKLEKEV